MLLKETIKKYIRRHKKGGEVREKHLKKVLSKLEEKQKIYETAYAKETSTKTKKKVGLHHKVATAQIKKVCKLLKDLDS